MVRGSAGGIRAARPDARRLCSPEHVLCSGGRLFVANTGGGSVWCCSAEGSVAEVYGGFVAPTGLAYDGARLYVADRGRGEVVRVDPESGERETVLHGLCAPTALALQGDLLAVAESGAQSISVYDRRTFATAYRYGGGEFSAPPVHVHLSALAACDEGLWFIDSEGPALRRMLNGTTDTFIDEGFLAFGDGAGGERLLHRPQGLACGIIGDGCGGGRLFISDAGSGKVKAFNPESGRTVILLEGLDGPGGLSKCGCTLYIAETGTHSILRFDLSRMETALIDFAL